VVKYILVFTAILLLACGGNDAGSADGAVSVGDAGIPFAQVAALWRKALCDRIYSCCSATERMQNPAIGTDVASCQPALNSEASLFLADIQASIDGGRVVYHPDRMAACLSALQAKSCDVLKMPPGDKNVTQQCEGVFESKVPIGGTCSGYFDCIGGWCMGDDGSGKDMCSPRKPLGGDCDEGPECESGLCDDDARVCIAVPAGSGNICSFGTEAVGQHGVIPPGSR
jgi:hypothetical protein